MPKEEDYKHYCSLHHSFSTVYADVNKRMMDLYPAPKKFLEETGPQINRYVNNFAAAETNREINKLFEHVFYFSNNFSHFAKSIVHLFDDYKTLHDESTAYMKKIFALREKQESNQNKMQEYITLIPQVNNLTDRLKQIEEAAKATNLNFKQLQADWAGISQKIKA